MTPESALKLPPLEPGLLTEDHKALAASRCTRCGERRFPAASICSGCQSRDVVRTALATEGIVYTFAVVRAAPPGYTGEVPYAVGVVELPDGIRVTTTLLADDLDDIQIGARVRFEPLPLDGVLAFAYRCAA